MHITLITGSHRPTGNSGRIGRFIEQQIQADGHTTNLIDLATTDLPFWDEGMWGADGLKDKWAEVWQPHAEVLQKSDGVVVVCPEYAGMASSKLKNVLLLCSAQELGHKAGFLVTVSSGVGGAYPVAELKAHAVKNNKLVWTPEHLIVRSADHMFTDNPPAEHAKSDAYLRSRLTFALGVFYQYAEALTAMRAKDGKLHDDAFPFGM
ncbi:MAG: NAD(P)H-dependent oxidoreductase [Pseudomonadaceae bacterium]|nr:NAD(P)H-dependent oxidoreductase [Pseudomonadaceae bacterium]